MYTTVLGARGIAMRAWLVPMPYMKDGITSCNLQIYKPIADDTHWSSCLCCVSTNIYVIFWYIYVKFWYSPLQNDTFHF